MAELIFGTAGIPQSTKSRNSVNGIERVKELGLGAMELEFTHGLHMGEATARGVGEAQKRSGIALSAHAPYYVNLSSKERKKRDASRKRILDSARIGALCGARIAVFHPGYYQDMEHGKVYEMVKAELEAMSSELRRAGNPVLLGLETTGKKSQFGSLEECVRLAKEVKRVSVCVDFSHLFARCVGCLKTKEDFVGAIDVIKNGNSGLLKGLHMHASGMNYTEKGERNHLNMQDSGNKFDYREMLKALHAENVSGTIISESPNIEGDALLMQKYWEGL